MSKKAHPKIIEKMENREKILRALLSGEKTWKELLEITKLPKSVLASHIKELTAEGLIIERIDSKYRRKKIYSIRVELLPDSILVDALSLTILQELSTEIMKLSITGDRKEITKRIGEYYVTLSLDDRGRKAVLKTLDYLSIGWDYILGTCVDGEVIENIEKKILKGGDQKLILEKAVNTLVEIYESFNVYKWIADNPKKFKELASKEGIKEEVSKKILNFAGEFAKRYEKILNTLKEDSPVFGTFVLSKLKEKYELDEKRIIDRIRNFFDEIKSQ